jgi:hypothetical protein
VTLITSNAWCSAAASSLRAPRFRSAAPTSPVFRADAARSAARPTISDASC